MTRPSNKAPWQNRLGRGLSAFLANPYTNLIKGLALITIGVSEASTKLSEDIAHSQLRLGHGLIIIGFFSLLEPLPHLLEGLDASKRYLSRRSAKSEPAEAEEKGGSEPSGSRSETHTS